MARARACCRADRRADRRRRARLGARSLARHQPVVAADLRWRSRSSSRSATSSAFRRSAPSNAPATSTRWNSSWSSPCSAVNRLFGYDVSFTNSALFMVVVFVLLARVHGGRAEAPADPRPLAGRGRRRGGVHRQHGQREHRQGRQEVRAVHLLAVLLHPVRQSGRRAAAGDPAGAAHLRGDQPHHGHRGAGVLVVRDRAAVGFWQAWPQVLLAVRAARRARAG